MPHDVLSAGLNGTLTEHRADDAFAIDFLPASAHSTPKS
jgi:hypothetical protein